MSDLTVTADAFSPAVERIFSEFAAQEMAGIAEAVAKAGKVGADSAKAASPRDSGDYASGWAWEVEDALGSAGVYVRVYNRKKPSLTHLLEMGHEKWVGGRDTGERVAGKPHIAPAADAAYAAFEGAMR